MFEIEMLPAREGDCLWIRYGDDKRSRQILIDGGRTATAKYLKARLAELPANQRKFELLVITHVDRDHIEGVLDLIKDQSIGASFKDIWFNGYDHLQSVELETFGAIQGERLSAELLQRRLPWNTKWRRHAACLDRNTFPRKRLDGDMTLTLISPDREKLTRLIPVWEKECARAGILPGSRAKPVEPKGLERLGSLNIEQLAASPFRADSGEPNGSSIALIAEWKKKRVLLSGDAHADRVIESIKSLKGSARRLRVDLLKVSHHGSERNTSKELLEMLDCRCFLISTNGSYFKHPSAETIARIIKFGSKGSRLCFNYRSDFTEVWDNAGWQKQYGYSVEFPEKSRNGTLRVTV